MFPFLLTFSWLLIQVFTAFSLLIPAVLCLFYFARRKSQFIQANDDELHEEKDYAIIVSARESSENLYALLRMLTQLNYTNYLVYVAGSRLSAVSAGSPDDKLVYLRTTRWYHSRFLHRFVIENFRRPHTHIAVLDSDSMVDENYLTCLNTYFNQGYQAVTCRQAHQSRTGIINMMQAAINNYRNFFMGKLMFSSGSSAALSCSGAAFTVSAYKTCLKTKTESTGFVSMLQTELIRHHRQIAFASDAIVYTNSIVTLRLLAGQHAQRVHNWFVCLLFSCKTIVRGAGRRNVNQLLYGLSALRMPLPTGILIGVACLTVNARIDFAMALIWVCILLSLPAYIIIAAAQFSGQSHRSETEGEESIALYEPEEAYEVLAQTI